MLSSPRILILQLYQSKYQQLFIWFCRYQSYLSILQKRLPLFRKHALYVEECFCFMSRFILNARLKVTAIGRPSGTATTISVTAIITESKCHDRSAQSSTGGTSCKIRYNTDDWYYHKCNYLPKFNTFLIIFILFLIKGKYTAAAIANEPAVNAIRLVKIYSWLSIA